MKGSPATVDWMDSIDFKTGILHRSFTDGRTMHADLEEGKEGFAIARIGGKVVKTEMPNLTLKLLRNMEKPEKQQKKRPAAKSRGGGKKTAYPLINGLK